MSDETHPCAACAKDPKAYKEVRRAVEGESLLWQARMGLAHWEIEHVFVDAWYYEGGADDHRVTAVCEARWNYQFATVRWFLPSAARHSEDRLRAIVVHELCHVLLSAEQSLVDSMMDLGTVEAQAAAVACMEKVELSTEVTARALLEAHGYSFTGTVGCGAAKAAAAP
jgi:hypothetical protein